MGSGHKYVSIQIICGTVCVLSILGSLAIILTYLLLKKIRSKARELLVHVSLMDIAYTSANFVGLLIPYRDHLCRDDDTSNSTCNKSDNNINVYQNVCKVQALIAVYGTVGSVLWTLALAVYLYYRIVSRDAIITRRLVTILYVVCYTLPLYVSLWLLLDNHLGYPHDVMSGAGWCSIRESVDELVILMTYDIWMWLGIIVLIPLYLVIHVHIRQQLQVSLFTHTSLNCV